MATATMEQTLAALERAGWRLQNLSHIFSGDRWSCILERRKLARDGTAVFASALCPTPGEALQAAWDAARCLEPASQVPSAVLPRLKQAMAAAKAALTPASERDHDDETF